MSDPKWPKKDGRPLKTGEMTPAQKDQVLQEARKRWLEAERDTEETKELAEERTK